MKIHDEIAAVGDNASEAFKKLCLLSSRKKNTALNGMADEFEKCKDIIIEANKKDIAEANNAGLDFSVIDRLKITDNRFDGMVKTIRNIASLKDPIGNKISRWIRPNGLEIIKQRVPLGVIAIIYESRPNVTVDAISLCIKTSNCVVLRGGKESVNTNMAIVAALSEGGRKNGLPDNSIQYIKTADYRAVEEIVKLQGKIDLERRRQLMQHHGGDQLMKTVLQNAKVPVIKNYKGVCHVYVDESADIDKAINIVENAKCQRPGSCNAMETLLVHEKIAQKLLPLLIERLTEKKVEFHGDLKARQIVPSILEASDTDYFNEHLALVMNIRVTDSIKEAVNHINKYGTHHSDAIVAESETSQKQFSHEIDSAAVYVNASTRFTDGGEFGMGAEIGISTDKIHCRGPMGLEELTTYKYVIQGNGQIR